jgi:hypothetical protein
VAATPGVRLVLLYRPALQHNSSVSPKSDGLEAQIWPEWEAVSKKTGNEILYKTIELPSPADRGKLSKKLI